MNRIDTNRIFNFVADGHECLAFGNSYESAALAAKFKIDIRSICKIRSSYITNFAVENAIFMPDFAVGNLIFISIFAVGNLIFKLFFAN